jgi:hypothetical protein
MTNLVKNDELSFTNIDELVQVSEVEKDNAGRLSWSF